MERVTITIDDGLLRRVDEIVDGHYVKNRSHAVDLLLKKALAGKAVSQAVILAGGSAEKLAAPSGKAIKPLVDLGGMAAIERIVAHLSKSGVGESIVCYSVHGEEIVEKLKQLAQPGGLQLEFLLENAPGGSAGGLLLARRMVKDTFVLSYADVLYDELDVSDMIRFHKANNALCTLALASVKDPKHYGVATMRGSRITELTEKPESTSSYLVNAGAAICEPEIFELITSGVKSFERDLLPIIAEKQRLFGYVYSGPWFDLGSQSQLEAARKHFSNK